MKTYSFSLFIVCLLTFSSFTSGDIRSLYIVPYAASSAFAADLDLDRKNDLVVGHKTAWQHTNPTISIMKNNGNGIFSISDTSTIFCGYQDNIFAVDMNNDGYPDIVAMAKDFSSGTAVNYIRVYYNSIGTFRDYYNFNLNTSATPNEITYGDVDGNGYPDLVVASNGSEFWGILYNDGKGNFSAPVYYGTPGSSPTGLACGDLNKDGRDEIIVFGAKTEIYYSLASGFHEVLFGEPQRDGWIQDINLDGNNDIVCCDDRTVTMFENNGSETFIRHDGPLLNDNSFHSCLSDFDNDSLPDVLLQFGNGYNDIVTVRDYPSSLDIRFNDGKGHFVDHPLAVQDKTRTTSLQTLKCYPNPASDKITVETSGETMGYIVEVVNEQGKSLLTQKVTRPRTQLDISALPAGVDLVRVTGSKPVQVGKFVKQ